MNAQIPLGPKRNINIQIPSDFKFSEIPKAVVRIVAYLKVVCASACTVDEK